MEKSVKRTRDEVRAAFKESVRRKQEWIEESTRFLEHVRQQRMSGMTMEQIFA